MYVCADYVDCVDGVEHRSLLLISPASLLWIGLDWIQVSKVTNIFCLELRQVGRCYVYLKCLNLIKKDRTDVSE